MDRVVREVGKWSVSGGPVLVIAIDGHGASGKSTYAASLAARLGAAVLHTDDFFQRISQRGTGNSKPNDPLGCYYDWCRLRAEALVPLRSGRDATFRRYDWELDDVSGPDVIVRRRLLVVLEGVFSSAPQLGDVVDRSVLVDAPEDERLRRLRRRVAQEDWDAEWLLAEQTYFTGIRPPSSFDLVISGVGPVLADLPGGPS